ncbi:MAG: hypothetical protein J6V07_06255 [Clostridia bacterium]|nr:hypothetical protein [Clostridia bacterium]
MTHGDDGFLPIPTDATLAQFYASTNHVTQHAYLNGTTEIPPDTNGV